MFIVFFLHGRVLLTFVLGKPCCFLTSCLACIIFPTVIIKNGPLPYSPTSTFLGPLFLPCFLLSFFPSLLPFFNFFFHCVFHNMTSKPTHLPPYPKIKETKI